jgi:hypothetical protein
VTVLTDSNPPQAADARQGPRVNVSWAARIVMGPQSYLDARVINISADGLGLVCERAFADGVMLQVLIAMPDPADRSKYLYPGVVAKAMFHVAKGGKFRIGTRFAKIDPPVKAMIEQWVQKD